MYQRAGKSGGGGGASGYFIQFNYGGWSASRMFDAWIYDYANGEIIKYEIGNNETITYNDVQLEVSGSTRLIVTALNDCYCYSVKKIYDTTTPPPYTSYGKNGNYTYAYDYNNSINIALITEQELVPSA